MSWIRSHLTFANVASSVALFVALGGSAYAATNGLFVSRSGTIHGCVHRSGELSVTRAGRRCPRHTKNLTFNQTGPQGRTGTAGAAGPGATSYLTTVASHGEWDGVTLPNGVTVTGGCPAEGGSNNVFLRLLAGSGAHGMGGQELQASGTEASDGTLASVDADDAGGFGLLPTGNDDVDIDVIARSSAATTDEFYRVDVHADYDSGTTSCNFWAVTVPAS
jgi:hypothetical protein